MPPKIIVLRLVWRLRLEVWKVFSLPLLLRLRGTKAELLILGQRWFYCFGQWFHCYFCCFCSCCDLWCNMLSLTRTTLRLYKRRWRTTAWQLSTSSWFLQRWFFICKPHILLLIKVHLIISWIKERLFYLIMTFTKVVSMYSVLKFHESYKNYLKLPRNRWQRKTQKRSSFLRWKKFTN